MWFVQDVQEEELTTKWAITGSILFAGSNWHMATILPTTLLLQIVDPTPQAHQARIQREPLQFQKLYRLININKRNVSKSNLPPFLRSPTPLSTLSQLLLYMYCTVYPWRLLASLHITSQPQPNLQHCVPRNKQKQ